MLVNWPVDQTGRGVGAKGNEGVVTTVLQTPYSIGYVELSYALEHGLKFAAVMNKAGIFTLPSVETIQAAARGIVLPESPLDDFSHTLKSVVFSSHEDAYPLSSLAYGTFWARYEDPSIRKSIARFLRWIADEGYKHMVRGYVPPPPDAVKLILEAARIIEMGGPG